MDEAAECSICAKLFQDPRNLPCGHTFCLQCRQKLEQLGDAKEELTCPLCSKPWRALSLSLSELPKNFVAAQVVEQREQMVTCNAHVNERTWGFCKSCKTLVCLVCLQFNHKAHDEMVVELNKADAIFRQRIDDTNEEYNEKRKFLIEKRLNIHNILAKIDETTSKSIENLHQCSAKAREDLDKQYLLMKNAIDSRETELKNTVINFSATEKERLSSIKQDIETQLQEIQRFQTAFENSASISDRLKLFNEPQKRFNVMNHDTDWSKLKPDCFFNKRDLSFKVQPSETTVKAWNVVSPRFTFQESSPDCIDRSIDIVSQRANTLLAASRGSTNISIFNTDSSLFSTSLIETKANIYDAVLAAQNTIICTSFRSGQVLTYSENRLILEQTLMGANGISIDKKDAVIIAAEDSVYRLKNYRKKLQRNCRIIHFPEFQIKKAIKITTHYPHIVWLICTNRMGVNNLIQCTYNNIGESKIIKKIETRDFLGNPILLDDLTVDYTDKIFVSDSGNKRIHLYNFKGDYMGEVFPSKDHFNKPHGIAFDSTNHVLYVGQNEGKVTAYEEGDYKTKYCLELIV